MNSTDLLAKLKEPFDPGLIHWRVGATTQDKKKGSVTDQDLLPYREAIGFAKRFEEC